MDVTRRDLLKLLAIAAASGIDPRRLEADDGPGRLLEFEPLGTVTLLPLTDAPAPTRPVFYREPDTLIGVGDERGKPPFVTGAEFLRAYHLAADSAAAYAYTSLDFPALAARYGRMGGYAHLATLVKRVRAERPGRTLLLDGGDTIQGSAPALWTRGEDMVRVSNELGVDVLTAHWEFVYGIDRVRELFGDRARTGLFAGDFVAHNVRELGWNDRVFRPYTIRRVGGVSVGVIGRGSPHPPVSHPRRFVPDLTFGIRQDGVQALVNELRDARKADLIVLLSHNGISVDLKLAARVRGLDVILGGHTHDALPLPIVVGRTLVVNSGSHGKFLSRLDLDVRRGRVADHRYRLIPVLAHYVPEHLGEGAGRAGDPPDHGGRRRQPLPPGPVLSPGRGHGPAGRTHLHDPPRQAARAADQRHPHRRPAARARAALQGGGLGERRDGGRWAAGVGRRRRPPAPPRACQARPAPPRARRLTARGPPPASESADFSTPSSALASAESGRWRG